MLIIDRTSSNITDPCNDTGTCKDTNTCNDTEITEKTLQMRSSNNGDEIDSSISCMNIHNSHIGCMRLNNSYIIDSSIVNSSTNISNSSTNISNSNAVNSSATISDSSTNNSCANNSIMIMPNISKNKTVTNKKDDCHQEKYICFEIIHEIYSFYEVFDYLKIRLLSKSFNSRTITLI